MPAASMASTMPRARGSSGATITKSIALALAQATMPSTSVAFTSMQVGNLGDARIAGGTEELGDFGGLGQFPADGVLPAAASYH